MFCVKSFLVTFNIVLNTRFCLRCFGFLPLRTFESNYNVRSGTMEYPCCDLLKCTFKLFQKESECSLPLVVDKAEYVFFSFRANHITQTLPFFPEWNVESIKPSYVISSFNCFIVPTFEKMQSTSCKII